LSFTWKQAMYSRHTYGRRIVFLSSSAGNLFFSFRSCDAMGKRNNPPDGSLSLSFHREDIY
jgi:hypothetical protein